MIWGHQVDASVISDVDNGRRRAAAYLAKYATKGSDDHGVLDHRLRSGIPWDARLPDHLRTLVKSALAMSDRPELEMLRLRPWAHTCGFRGHFLTKSRRYSTTFQLLRAERLNWRLVERGEGPLEHGSLAVECREWRYEGWGYVTLGDVCLARNLEDDWRLGRLAAREADAVPTTTGEFVLAQDETNEGQSKEYRT
jgi:hypothetical protein